MQVRIHQSLKSNSCKKKPRIKSPSNQTEINIPSSINQMLIQWGGKSHQVAVW